jgi:hypothetical protein
MFVPYVSLTKAFVWDGSTHTEITRAVGGDYSAGETRDWNGTMLGGVAVFNNGVDVPQFWATASIGVRLANLTNWPAGLRAKVVRAFGPYLVAINITDGGASYPHLVEWSHPADPGSVPSSWDYTDPTKDAGRNDLPDVNSGVLVEMLPLQSAMYLYKENAIWRMTRIPGRFIFDFKTFLETVGVLAPRCVAATGDGLRHVVATQDDIIWHNGNTQGSILDRKQKKRLFNEIDTTNYRNSFMFDNPRYSEMYFCYPGPGQVHPDRALVMNYAKFPNWVLTEMDGVTFRNAYSGNIEAATNETWDSGSGSWDEDVEPWSSLIRRRVVLCSPSNTRFYNFDKSGTRDGAAFVATLQREGLSVIGKKRDGSPIVDHEVEKMIKRLWPKVSGGPIRIRIGMQQVVDGPTQWGEYGDFDPSAGVVWDPDIPMSGRATAIEFTSTPTSPNAAFRLDGYKVELEPLGSFHVV